MKKIFIFVLFSLALALPASAAKEEKYDVPDVKNDYCGIVMPFQDCKCAFHNEYCEASVKKNSRESRAYVMDKFNAWVGDLIYKFGSACVDKGGKWSKPTLTCTYLDKTEQLAKDSDTRSVEEKYGLPNLDFTPVPKSSSIKGKVLVADGKVFIWSADFRKWTGPVNGGALLHNGDVLITKDQGKAVLVMYGKSGQDTIDVGTDTFFEIPDPTNFKEYDQSLWGIIKDTALEVYNATTGKDVKVPAWYRQMNTVTVGVGARGTHYIVVDDEKNKTTKVFLKEGEMDLTPIAGGETVLLHDGESYVYSNGEVATSTMSEEDWSAARAQYGFTRDRIYVSEEDLVVPSKDVGDVKADDAAKINRSDIVPDRNFFEEQVGSGGSFSWWILIFAVFAGGGVYYWKFKK